jgi:hypothetical protein
VPGIRYGGDIGGVHLGREFLVLLRGAYHVVFAAGDDGVHPVTPMVSGNRHHLRPETVEAAVPPSAPLAMSFAASRLGAHRSGQHQDGGGGRFMHFPRGDRRRPG